MNAYPSNTVAAIDQAAFFNANSFEDVQTLCEDLFLVCRVDFPEDVIAYLYDPEGCVQDNDPYGLYDYDGLTDEEADYHGIYHLSEIRELDTRPTNHYWKGICFACDKPEELCTCEDFDKIPF